MQLDKEPAAAADGAAVTWFPSKVDWWLVPLLALAPVAAAIAAVATLVAGRGEWMVAAGGFVFVVLLYAGLVFPMRYGIGGGELIVRHGLVRQRCKLSDIVDVYPTHNPLSSPALSLDRLMISKGPGFFDSIMISPADKEGFLSLLARQADLERRGEHLVRPGAAP